MALVFAIAVAEHVDSAGAELGEHQPADGVVAITAEVVGGLCVQTLHVLLPSRLAGDPRIEHVNQCGRTLRRPNKCSRRCQRQRGIEFSAEESPARGSVLAVRVVQSHGERARAVSRDARVELHDRALALPLVDGLDKERARQPEEPGLKGQRARLDARLLTGPAVNGTRAGERVVREGLRTAVLATHTDAKNVHTVPKLSFLDDTPVGGGGRP